MAEYMLAEEKDLVALADELSYTDGAQVACGFGTVYEGLERLGISGNDCVLVTGLGPAWVTFLFLAGLFAAVGAGVATNFDTYIVTHFWEIPPDKWRWVIASLFVSALIPIVSAPYLTAKLDKKRVPWRSMPSRSASLPCLSL